MTELETFRRQKDRYLKTSPDSPIPPDQRGDFAGLAYYPENAGLRLIVQPEEFAEQEPIRMITSTGGEQEYLRWGRFSFEVEEQPATLTIYYASWGGFFVPFVDATSGARPTGPDATSSWRRSRMGRFWPTSTWPTTHTAPTRKTIAVQSHRPRIGSLCRCERARCSIRGTEAVRTRQSCFVRSRAFLAFLSVSVGGLVSWLDGDRR